MMDKRTILALAIIMGAMLAWSFFMAPQPQSTAEAPQSQAAPQELATPASPTTPAAPAAQSAVPQDQAPGREVKVETPNYLAVFDETGGRLKSFTLKKYFRQKMAPDDPSVPVELVSVPNPADWPLNMYLFEDGARHNLDRLVFTADQSSLDLAAGGQGRLTFSARTQDGLVITRTLSFSADNYLINQSVTLKNEGEKTRNGFVGMRINAAPFTHVNGRYNSMAAYLNNSLETDSAEDAASALAAYDKKLTRADWVGYMDQYFLTAFVYGGEAVPSIGAFFQDHGGLAVETSWPLALVPGQEQSNEFSLYYGPKDEKDLEAAGHHLDKSVDFGWFTFLARPLAALLRFFHSIVGNYGVAIILTTILIKIVLWPLTAKSYRSMKEMQKLQPKVMKLREKYADDRETMNREVMQLYRTFKVSPMGGCLPMLLQIPFFIAFYRVLDYALELRGAPFMLWIQDLSAPDRLFRFNVELPLMELPTGIPVLTLLMGASMLWQQKMAPSMGDPTQAKIMMFMPVVFTFILINMPAGLVLYWLVNNILSIGQQKLINRGK